MGREKNLGKRKRKKCKKKERKEKIAKNNTNQRGKKTKMELTQ